MGIKDDIEPGATTAKIGEHSRVLTISEKVGYSLGDLAANLVFQTLVTYLAYFYTDIYGLKTEHAYCNDPGHWIDCGVLFQSDYRCDG